MRIALPPPRLPNEFNLRKQQEVFDLVLDPSKDTVLEPVSLGTAAYNAAHDPRYVDDVLYRGAKNGWGNSDPRVLAHVRHSNEALWAAVGAVLDNKGDEPPVAFAPVSGFHHAHYDHGYGYCTFNGLVISILEARRNNLLQGDVLIIDGDGHHGDGTEDIITKLGLISTNNLRLDAGAVKGSATVAGALIDMALGAYNNWDLVLYQAGADAHKDDPYGAGYLTDGEFTERDLRVFRLCKERNIPLVWCLAGGYNGTKTIGLHTRTFAAALQVFYPGQTRLPAARGAQSGILGL